MEVKRFLTFKKNKAIYDFDSAEKRSLVVTLNPSFPQDKLREGSQVWENMRFFPFAEPVLEARSGPKGSE